MTEVLKVLMKVHGMADGRIKISRM